MDDHNIIEYLYRSIERYNAESEIGTVLGNYFFVSVNLKTTRIDIFINGYEYYANLEMQNRRVKGYHLPKRSKYHHSELTHNQLKPADDFDELKPTIVIFVCMYDEFDLNLPKYTARMKIEETDKAEFNDGTITVLLNMAYRGDDLPKDVQAVYEYFRNGNCLPGNEMVHRLDEKVHEVNDTGKETIMTFEKEIERQAAFRAEEMAKDMAKDLAEDMAKDMAEDMAKDMAKDLAEGMAKDLAEGMAKDLAKDLAEDMAKDLAEGMAKGMAEDIAKDMAEDIAKDMAQDLVKEQVQKAEKSNAYGIAERMIRKGLPVEDICELTGLCEDEIERLRTGNNR